MDNITQISYLINLVPGFESYLSKSGTKFTIEKLEEYRDLLKKSQLLNEELALTIELIKESYYKICSTSAKSLHFLDRSKSLNDSLIIKEFKTDMDQCYKKRIREKAEIQHYKTFREYIISKAYDFDPIINKYVDCWHPYVCSKLGIAYCMSKKYDIGLTFLQRSLLHVFSCPNIYWNNPTALRGCTDALHEVQHLLGREWLMKIDSVLSLNGFEILKYLYLYVSRMIYYIDSEVPEAPSNIIVPKMIDKINYLSIRADLIYHYKQDFLSIFGPGVNPEIQFMADKYMSYYYADICGLQQIAKDCYWDAIKMYRHGSLIVNGGIGTQEYEDATFGELIERGNKRSETLAYSIYEQAKRGYYKMDKCQITNLVNYIGEKSECPNIKNLPWNGYHIG